MWSRFLLYKELDLFLSQRQDFGLGPSLSTAIHLDDRKHVNVNHWHIAGCLMCSWALLY